jgi:2-alkenal reductase
MKLFKALTLIGIFALLLSGCNFSVFATATPATPVSLGQATATPVVTPMPLPAAISIAADAEELLLENLYERVNPGVVNIDLISGTGADATEFGSGSGFVIDLQGHIVTNNHVVEGADELDVTFSDGTVAVAKIIGADPYSDLAVIKVEVDASLLHPLPLGDSDLVKVGQRVIAIGNPFGLFGTMTVGIISGKGRTLQADPSASTGALYSNPDIIQTDAAINPGNSGGPLLNSKGEVIAVNAAIRNSSNSTNNRANSGVGFSIPSNTVKRVSDQILKDGRAAYPYLGVSVDNHFSLGILALELSLPVNKGVLIASVIRGGPADKAGLLGGDRQVTVRGLPVTAGGDIITAIDGDSINSFDDMIAYLSGTKQVGQTVTVTILRDTQTLQLPVTLTDRPK